MQVLPSLIDPFECRRTSRAVDSVRSHGKCFCYNDLDIAKAPASCHSEYPPAAVAVLHADYQTDEDAEAKVFAEALLNLLDEITEFFSMIMNWA